MEKRDKEVEKIHKEEERRSTLAFWIGVLIALCFLALGIAYLLYSFLT